MRIQRNYRKCIFQTPRDLLARIQDTCFMYICIFGFKSASTFKVLGARNEMVMDDYDGQMIFGNLVAPKLPYIRPTGEEKPHPGNLSRPGIEPGPAA